MDICKHSDEDAAIRLGNILNEKCDIHKVDFVDRWKPSLSIGVSSVTSECVTPSEVLVRADKAMYVSKSSGGNKTTSYMQMT